MSGPTLSASVHVDGSEIFITRNGCTVEVYPCHAGYLRPVGHWWARISDGRNVAGKKFATEAEAKTWAMGKLGQAVAA